MEKEHLDNIPTTGESCQICSPIQFAECLGHEDNNPKNKLLYKNNDYLREIRVIFMETPKDDERSCFYASVSILLYRMVNYETVQFLRKKFAYLVNYQRLISAQEPELTMKRLVMEITNNRHKDLPEDMFTGWHSQALNSGASRIFNFLLSYILNNPVYLLDLSTNQWRENNLSNANPEQSQFHANFIGESLPFNTIGPPFMLAEHSEVDGTRLRRTHVAAMMHEEFTDGSIECPFPLKKYIKLMNHRKMIETGSKFIFASDSEDDDSDDEDSGDWYTDEEDSEDEDWKDKDCKCSIA